MEQYSVLAKYYDALMDDVDYKKWAEFYDVILKESNVGKRIVDMGCGTGSITVCLASLGYDMTGIDISSEMLALAQSKADKAGVRIRFSEQDMSGLDVGGGYGGVICSFDGVNYLLSTEKLKSCFERAYDALTDGGVFVFDVSTPYKYKNILGSNAFVYELDDLFTPWATATAITAPRPTGAACSSAAGVRPSWAACAWIRPWWMYPPLRNAKWATRPC